MIKPILVSCVCVFAHISSAAEECKPFKLDAYRKTIEAREKVDPLLQKMPKNPIFAKPEFENCYVKLMMMIPADSEYFRFYLFDSKGELVNVRPSAGPNIMTCNDSVKKNVDYFNKLLEKKRKENKNLPPALAFPKRVHLFIANCLIIFTEHYQDDPKKPLLLREWVFDHNENIFKYGKVERDVTIIAEDKLVK
jgi:hypothetical protein